MALELLVVQLDDVTICQVALERRHWEAAGRAEDVKKELERKHVDKVFFLFFYFDFIDVDKDGARP